MKWKNKSRVLHPKLDIVNLNCCNCLFVEDPRMNYLKLRRYWKN